MFASFPHAPQALTRMVDALAEAAGKSCPASIQLAVRRFSIADEASYDMSSVQNSIYTNFTANQEGIYRYCDMNICRNHQKIHL